MKHSVVDDPPRYIKGIDFNVLSPQDIIKAAEVEISTRELYDLSKGRTPKEHGAIDRRMGVSNNFSECETCHGRLATCQGHFGHVKLALPVFHVGYFKQIISILQSICKECSRILLDEDMRRKFLAELRRPELDNLRRMNILKKVIEQCKKQRKCLHCGSTNGVVKKAGALKIIHDKFRHVPKKGSEEKDEFDASFRDAKQANPDIEKILKRAMDDMNPLKVLNLFREIVSQDCQLLGMDPTKGRPEMYIWTYVPAPPVCIRPSVAQDNATNEDDLTVKLAEIVFTSCSIRAGMEKGMTLVQLMEHWDYMQLTLALYINADTPSGPGMPAPKPIRALCQRLKGKQGRFRGNLSGKRVDFSGRTVISPDPNLRVDEVAVPDRVAKILTYPEKVTQYNREKLKELVLNGSGKYPGANYVMKKNADRLNLRFGRRGDIAANLEVGDIVERHIEDGDIVLFNRQPSLHRLSILSHFAKVRPWRTFRLNECVCTPYNADFDGDEMNLHVPQTEEARAEAMALMGVKSNLVTPQSGEPIIAATQDFITGSYLIARKDSFYDRAAFCELLATMCDGNLHFDLPPPAIQKPVQLWTGKQVFSLLIKPNKDSNVIINLEAKNKTFHPPDKGLPPEMSPNDGYLMIRGSEVLCGNMDKSTLGDGKKHSVFFAILRDYGPEQAATAMNRMAKMCARFLGSRGFSIGIGDVTPGVQLNTQKDSLVESAYAKCDDLIEQLRLGKLETQPGCDEEQTLEAKIGGLLSKVREQVGDVCIKELEKSNAPLIMATCGSKGSTLNVSQMVAVVGQQIISGSRVPDGFQDRSLPHFPKFSKTPPSKGFVRNSFFTGLSPPEFLFHAISGREGLVDTAVKTAETGYMSRRLMKSLEDLSSQYDNTVRTSANGIVQFHYGGDGLDPFDMEGDAVPVNFVRTWHHAHNITFDNDEPNLLPYEIIELADKILIPLEAQLQRKDNLGNSVYGIDAEQEIYADERDPQRDYYQTIRKFIFGKAKDLGDVRARKGMLALLERPEGEEYEGVDFDELVSPTKKFAVDQVYKTSGKMVREFLRQCLKKYERSKVEPGTAVGAIGAQSIGEPGTQMTLKTFHFAGVASMNVTLGVPRIKEIINASKTISTPIITAVLQNNKDERVARMIKGRIEKTHLRDVVKYVEDVYSGTQAHIAMRIDWRTIDRLRLELSISEIAAALVKAPKLKIESGDVQIVGDDLIRVGVRTLPTGTGKNASAIENEMYYRAQTLRRALPNVVVKGFPDIARAVINIQEKTENKELLVEGYGLKDVMTTDGIVGTETTTNHVLENYKVLGIEAARASIINEIDTTMSSHGMSVDPRHIQLLGDVMTFKGEVLGITRFGLAKMRDSVLQLASFEKTTDHLFDAAFYMKSDSIDGVSECIILGQTMSIGTGAFKMIRPLEEARGLGKKPTFFEDMWDELSHMRIDEDVEMQEAY